MATAPRKRSTTATTSAPTTKAVAAKKKSVTAKATTETITPVKRVTKPKAPVKPVPQGTDSFEPVSNSAPVPVTRTMSAMASAMLESDPDKAILMSMKGHMISISSAGTISAPEAIVMAGKMLASVFLEMSTEDQYQLPLHMFMENVARVAHGRIKEQSPNAPVFFKFVNNES